MSQPVTIRTRRYLRNALLSRRQMVIDVVHPGRALIPHADLKNAVAKLFKVQDPKTIFFFGFKSIFGGGRSTGFCLIYDNLEEAKKFEPKHRLKPLGFGKAAGLTRKAKKDLKGRKKRTWGTGRRLAAHKAKKNQ